MTVARTGDRPVDEFVGGPVLVLLGLGLFLVGGVLAALLAARILGPDDYTVFAAFISLWGVAILAPGGAFEQESTVRAVGRQESTRGIARAMGIRSGVLWVLVAVLLMAPLGWQPRLLGNSWQWWVGAIVIGGAIVFATAIGRGIATGRGHYAVVGGASAITGLAMVVVPLALLRLGQPALTSFLVGAVVAWIAGLVVVAFAGLTRRLRLFDTIAGDPVTGGTALLVAGNLLMTASVLAVPSVLRWHVGTIGAELTADVQLVVSLSRLASTVVLGLVPIMIATMSGMQGRRHVSTQTWLVVATGFAALSVATLTLIGAPAVSWLTGRATDMDLGLIVAATGPVILLAPAVVLMALATLRHRFGVIILAWLASLVALIAGAIADPTADVMSVLAWIATSALLPFTILAVGLAHKDRANQTQPAASGGSQ